jgi:transcriptional regulator with XRE-family HTH domain
MPKIKAPMAPGKQLKAWRTRVGRTQTECAAEVGVKQSAWAEWEAGSRTPRDQSIDDIAKLTGGEVPAAAWPRRRGEAA